MSFMVKHFRVSARDKISSMVRDGLYERYTSTRRFDSHKGKEITISHAKSPPDSRVQYILQGAMTVIQESTQNSRINFVIIFSIFSSETRSKIKHKHKIKNINARANIRAIPPKFFFTDFRFCNNSINWPGKNKSSVCIRTIGVCERAR